MFNFSTYKMHELPRIHLVFGKVTAQEANYFMYL